MKSFATGILLVLFSAFIGSSAVHADSVGPYSGQVIDAETGQPIQGASVFMYWTKLVTSPDRRPIDPRLVALALEEGVNVKRLLLIRSDEADVRLLYTDNKGEYKVPSFSVQTGVEGEVESFTIIIYQPGWQAYIQEVHFTDRYSRPDSDFHEKNNVVRLLRIPANFDHGEHYDAIEDALSSIPSPPLENKDQMTWDEVLQIKLKTLPEKAELLRRIEWEVRRSREDFDNSYSSFSANRSAYLPQWMNLLKKGNAKEKQIALANLGLLLDPEYRKDSSVFGPIIRTLKDKDPSVREAATAFLKTLGDQTRGCCLEAGIVPALSEALRDERAAVRMEAAKALGHYKDKRAVDALIGSLKDPDVWVRLNIINSLGAYLGERESAVSTVPYIPNESDKGLQKKPRKASGGSLEIRGHVQKRMLLGYSWGDAKVETVVETLVEMLNENSQWQNMFVQQECVRTLGRIETQDRRAITALLQRSGVDYLKRDVIKALGKMRALEAEEFLAKELRNRDASIRKITFESLLKLPIEWGARNNSDALSLYKAQLRDSYQEVRAYSVVALGKIGGKVAFSCLREALKDESELVVGKALKGLEYSEEPEVLVDYVDLFGSKNKLILDTARAQFKETAKRSIDQFAYVFRSAGSKYVIRKQEEKAGLIIFSDSIPEKFKGPSFQVTKRYVHPATAAKLVALSRESDVNAKLYAMEVITLFEDDRIEKALLALVDDNMPRVSVQAITLLGQSGSSKSVPRLIQILKASDQQRKRAAINALADIRDARAEAPIRDLLDDKNPEVRAAAMRYIDSVGQQDVADMAISVLITRPSQAQVLAALKTIKKTRDMRAVEPLIAILKEKKGKNLYEVREVVVLLGDLGDNRAVDPIMDTLNYIAGQGVGFIDNGMKYDAIDAIVKLNDKRAVPLLIQMLRSTDAGIKEKSISALGVFKDPSAVPGLIEVSSEARFIQKAVTALGSIGDPAALDHLEKLLYDYEPKEYSAFIVRAIGAIHNEKSVDILLRYLMSGASLHGNGNAAISALIKQKNKKAIKPILKYAEYDDRQRKQWKGQVHGMIAYELKHYGIPDIRQLLGEYLYDDDRDIRIGAIRVLGGMGDRRDLAPLKKLLEDADPDIQVNAVAAIKRIEYNVSILDKKN